VSISVTPANASSGGDINIKWQTTNSGNAPIKGSFYERVLIRNTTTAQVLGSPTRYYDATQPTNGFIAAGEGRSRELSFRLPDGTNGAGNLQVEITADVYDQIVEVNLAGSAESNNNATNGFVSSLSAYPDLVVGGISNTSSAIPGQFSTITWAVTNLGAGAISGTWAEQVFLSDDTVAGNDQLLATFVFTNTLVPGQWIMRTQQVTIPVFGAGNRWFVVAVDAGNSVYELNEANNLGIGNGPITIPVASTLSLNRNSVNENAGNNAATAVLTRNSGLDSSVVFALVSSDTNKLVVPPTVVFAAGQTSVNVPLDAVDNAVVDGNVTVAVSASGLGYLPVTNFVTVLDNDTPTLTVQVLATTISEAAGPNATMALVIRNTETNSALTVTLSSSDSTRVTVPTSVTIPVGARSAAIKVAAVNNDFPNIPAPITITASTPGFSSIPASLTVLDDDTPGLSVTLNESIISEAAPSPAAFVTVTRSSVSTAPLSVALLPTPQGIISLQATAVIPGNQASVSVPVSVINDQLVNGNRLVQITATPLDGVYGTPIAAGAASASLTIADDDGPALSLAINASVIKETGVTSGTVTRNTPAINALVVNLASSNPGEATVPAAVTIPNGQSSVTFAINGVTDNTPDGVKRVTITANATGFSTGAAGLDVTDVDLPDLQPISVTVPSTGSTRDLINISWVVTNRGLSSASAFWSDRVYLAGEANGANAQFLATFSHSGGLPLNSSYTGTGSVRLPDNPGTFYVMIYTDEVGAVDETTRQNNVLIHSTPLTISPDYRATIQAGVHTGNAGTPILLTGRAYRVADNSSVPLRPVTIRILSKGTRRIISVNTDASGNFSTYFQPLPTEAGNYQVAADHPGVNEDNVQDTFILYGVRFTDYELVQRVFPLLPITNLLSLVNLGDTPLSGITYTVENVSTNVSFAVTGPNSLTPTSTVPVTVVVQAGPLSANNVVNARIRVNTTEGAIGYLPLRINATPQTATLVSDPSVLESGMLRGQRKVIEFEVGNIGGASSGPLNVVAPNVPWFNLNSPSNMPALLPGEVTKLSFTLSPAADLPLTRYDGTLVLNGLAGSVTIPYRFRALSEGHGDLSITVLDDFTYYAEGAPKVEGATVTLTDPLAGTNVATGITGSNGVVVLTNVMEGSYQMRVSAEKHSSYAAPVQIVSGSTTEKTVFIDRETVRYRWTVVPTTIEDHYQVVLEPVFETEVPVPVVTLDNPRIVPVVFPGEDTQFEIELSNHGLVAAEQLQIDAPEHPNFIIEPLIKYVDVLPAKSSIKIPVKIRSKSNGQFINLRNPLAKSGGTTFTGCESNPVMKIKFSWICGPERRWHGLQADVEAIQVECSERLKDLFKKLAECAKDKFPDIASIRDLSRLAKLRELAKECIADSLCEIAQAIAQCSGDTCLQAITGLACGLVAHDIGGASGAAASMGNCICPGPIGGGGGSPTSTTTPPPWSPTSSSGVLSPPGSFQLPQGFEIGWEYTPADCDPGLHPTKSLTHAKAATQPGGVCAKVRLRLAQEVAITRNAFLGTYELDNDSSDTPVTGLSLVMDIRDDTGAQANNLFSIRGPELSGLSAVDGTGVVSTNSTGRAQYTFIPTRDAARTGPKVYRFGGTLVYYTGPTRVEVPLIPEILTVQPDPELHLSYFLQRDVLGDDPFTDETETSQPFALGLLVKNTGLGIAKNFRVTSAQPRIVENEKGLLIDFKLIGTQVGTNAVTPSLTVNLGDIASGKSSIATFLLTSSLQGKFIEYNATFEHIDGLGDPRLSLIDSVEIHQLTKLVRANRIGDDSLADFLVNDEPDVNNLPDTLYLSDGTVAPVNVGSGSFDRSASPGQLQVVLTANMPSGWAYLRLPDPGTGYRLHRVVRSDGKEILVGTNVWTTDRSFPSGLAGAVKENLIHLLDHNGTASYTFYYRTVDDLSPSITSIGNGVSVVQTTALDTIDVAFSETIDLATFDRFDLALSRNGGGNLIASGVLVANVATNIYRISGLAPLTGADGNYQLTVLGGGIQDFGGNALSTDASFSWAKGSVSPVVVSIAQPAPNPRNTAVSTIDVAFSLPVGPASFENGDLQLKRNGSSNLIGNGVTITSLSPTTFRIGGLASLTGADGDYQLTVLGSGVLGTDATPGQGALSQSWSTLTTGPQIVALESPEPAFRNTVVASLTVTFARAIDSSTFDWRDLSLVRDGGPELVTSDVLINRISDTVYRVSNINWVQGLPGTYTLTANASGVRDLAGNFGSGSVSQSWTLKLTKPGKPLSLAITPDLGVSASDGLTASNSVTLSGAVTETNVTVRVYDDTMGIDLGLASITGTNFTKAIGFSALGAHNLRIYAVDPAQNLSANTFFTVFVDQTPPSYLLEPITPVVRTNGIVSLDVTFSEAINDASFDWQNMRLTRNGSGNLITSSNVVSIQPVTNNVYRISGLEALTEALGDYEFSVGAPGIEDRAGNTGIVSMTNSWQRIAPNTPPLLAVIPVQTVNEGSLLSFTASASDSNVPAQSLTFTLAGNVPAGASIDPATGQFSWIPNEAQGPSSNYFTVRVTDNGSPALNAEQPVVILVHEVNTAPVLAAIPPQIALIRGTLRVTNVVIDPDLPTNRMTFTLGAGAPNGMRLNTNSGVLSWSPARWQAPSSNFITIIVTDDGVPALSATNGFSVVVPDYLELTVGAKAAVLEAGQSASLPLTSMSSASVTNITFVIEAPEARLTNFGLQVLAPQISHASLSSAGPNRSLITLGTTGAQPLTGTNTLANLIFSATTNQTSAFIPLVVTEIGALQVSGVPVPRIIGNDGRAIVVARQPLVESLLRTNNQPSLILYGHVGTNYVVESAAEVSGPWQPQWQGTPTNLFQNLDSLIPTNQVFFFRARE
ncbi:MAG: hypothetical protein JWM16_629, partial [Verrucomicrobiales bacterium]|nr:hypothetical protein [Verrucomicrobiales bacterium]